MKSTKRDYSKLGIPLNHIIILQKNKKLNIKPKATQEIKDYMKYGERTNKLKKLKKLCRKRMNKSNNLDLCKSLRSKLAILKTHFNHHRFNTQSQIRIKYHTQENQRNK